jgi:dethiobiotin synthetase
VRKPAESGCDLRSGELFPADAAALREAAASEEPLEAICALRLAEPLAPAEAAARAGARLDVARLVATYRARAAEVDCLLVEGAGGLLVPLIERTSYADLALALGASVLVVVGARLGAINHALLTLEVARARGLVVLGLVVNHMSPAGDLATTTLAESLRRRANLARLAEIAFAADAAHALGAG